MKTTFRTIAAMSAAILALVSCSKENLIEKGKVEPITGPRVISLTMSGTKTVLDEDGLTPVFSGGDVIKLSNGSAMEDCTVSILNIEEQDVATITTNLQGELTAVYPASAARVSGNEIAGINVPPVQSGKFADANICTATIEAGATDAVFTNATAVLRFYVDASIGVKSITVTSSAANIADDLKTITVDPEGEATIDQVTDDPGKRICYVAVLPGAETTLKFSSVTTTQDSYENKTVTRTTPSISLEAGNIYNAFIPYYIKVKVSDNPETYQRWGYCNIGAFLPEDYGHYFAWGETTGHSFTDTPEDGYLENAFVFGKNNSGFSWSNAPFNGGESSYSETEFNKVKDTVCPNGVLALAYDAANVNWGGSWRMPTQEEFVGLAALDPGYTGWNDTNKGYRLTDANGNSIFLPAAGEGTGTDLVEAGETGYYWSSSWKSGYPKFAFDFCFFNEGIDANVSSARNLGFSVRPLSGSN